MRILVLTILSLLITFQVHAKKTKLGNYITYEGEYEKKGIGAIGSGSLYMLSKNNTFANSQGEKDYCVTDAMEGVFEGSHVTSARLVFNSAWYFEGTIDFNIDSQKRQYDKIKYTLSNGNLSFFPDKEKIDLHLGINDTIVIERYMDDEVITTTSSVFYINSDEKIKCRDLSLEHVLNVGRIICKQPVCINASNQLSGLVKKSNGNRILVPRSGTRNNTIQSLAVLTAPVIGQKVLEKWKLKKQGTPMFYDEANRSIVTSQHENIYKIEHGEDIITYDHFRLLSLKRRYEDATITYNDTVARILYANGDIYEGMIYSKLLTQYGYYENRSNMIRAFMSSHSINSINIDYYDGVVTKSDGQRDIYKHGHNINIVKSSAFTGEWEVSSGKAPNFDNMNYEGRISISPNKEYVWTIHQRDYGFARYPAVFRDSQRYGVWDIKGNELQLKQTPAKNTYSFRVYPSADNNLPVEEINKVKPLLEQEIAQTKEKEMSEGTNIISSFDVVDISDDMIYFYIGDMAYRFIKAKDENSINREYFIGRWGIADYDQVIDFNSDGTYKRYDTTKSYKIGWTENFSICIEGTWRYENGELILVSVPSKSIVQATVTGVNSLYARQATARKQELQQIAVSEQAKHRSNDKPRGTFSKVTSVSDMQFRVTDSKGNNYVFVKLPQ